MHIIYGDLFKASRYQCFILHIQNLIKKHHQQIIKEFFLTHSLTSMQKPDYLRLV